MPARTDHGSPPDALAVASPATPAGHEALRLLPEGFDIRLQQRGDIDGDGDDDMLVVLQKPEGGQAKWEPRPLAILRRGADGGLESAAYAPTAILCQACGGMMGDPLQELRIEPNGFVLRFEGGSRELWSREFRFEYLADAGSWKLVDIVDQAIDRLDGSGAESRRTSSDFGDVAIEHFDPMAFPAASLP